MLCSNLIGTKAHPQRKQLIDEHKATIAENKVLSSKIDVSKLLASGKVAVLDIDENGVAQVDYSNPTHQRWLED